ncbi:glutathione S-transferase family protein [Paraburkholderia rhizosphaerae]|uniref:glutathione transferase n=1 Tax=Paraburkholderia rhizosphaerae TaxID=480658 RepID=A0A4R8LYB4_9BURK|nr:glutathione S-transferase family protein [Paraburkholderia rhizosphaerae]TDY52206.1 glutathione S-transferase [Paraburkholderia rhizosphaerae]
MTIKLKLWGFSGSTYVRTVRMLLAEKGFTDYEQVPVNVLKGEPRESEHLVRHPFGKVPVVDVDGFRIMETSAIMRYLDTVLPGPSLTPATPKDRARMDMVTSIVDSYGYGPLVSVAGYYLFPDFIGGQNDDALKAALEKSRVVLNELMRIKGESPYLAGDALSIADLYLAPIVNYVALTPHSDEILALPGVGPWWDRVVAHDSFRSTAP